MASRPVSIIQWHELPDRPAAGEQVILEIEGIRGRSNHVGHGLCAGKSWSITCREFYESVIPDDRVVRWAHYPDPSWREP